MNHHMTMTQPASRVSPLLRLRLMSLLPFMAMKHHSYPQILPQLHVSLLVNDACRTPVENAPRNAPRIKLSAPGSRRFRILCRFQVRFSPHPSLTVGSMSPHEIPMWSWSCRHHWKLSFMIFPNLMKIKILALYNIVRPLCLLFLFTLTTSIHSLASYPGSQCAFTCYRVAIL